MRKLFWPVVVALLVYWWWKKKPAATPAGIVTGTEGGVPTVVV